MLCQIEEGEYSARGIEMLNLRFISLVISTNPANEGKTRITSLLGENTKIHLYIVNQVC